MPKEYLRIRQSPQLKGTINLLGAKNAVLPIMASLLLTSGKSTLNNVPNSEDVQQMIKLLTNLGAETHFDTEQHKLEIDTSRVNQWNVDPENMNKMRASILVMGPLLARFQKAQVALPGGCLIGARSIDLHLKGFNQLGVTITHKEHSLSAVQHHAAHIPTERRIVLEYPSVGATENIIMCATLTSGTTTLINASLEPEVLDLIKALQKMGAKILYGAGLTLHVTGTNSLKPITHTIMPDRLEAGSLLLATAITGGEISIPNGQSEHMDVFLEKLEEMGHAIETKQGITLKATQYPQAVNIKTGPYPGFPTDLQAPMMAALSLADGISKIDETVFENRLMHAQELKKMGAQIDISEQSALIRGVEYLYGCDVIASDIRASCALALAGLAAKGTTIMTGVRHWKRGYERLEEKLAALGAHIILEE